MHTSRPEARPFPRFVMLSCKAALKPEVLRRPHGYDGPCRMTSVEAPAIRDSSHRPIFPLSTCPGDEGMDAD